MKNKIKVLLVDDHAVVRMGFKLLIATSANIEVVAEASCGEQVIQKYQQHQPDIIVLDLSMSGIGGLETIKRMIHRDKTAKILVFSVHDEQVYVSRALNAGAKGYLCKTSAPEKLLEAILCVYQGESYIEQGLSKQLDNYPTDGDYQKILATFSTREFDIFRLLAKGLTPHKIADDLCLSYKTVANYITQIKKKLTVSTLAELTHIAILLGILKN